LKKRVLAVLAIVIGVGGIIAMFATFKSVRSEIESTYQATSSTDNGRSKEFRTPSPPTEVVARILSSATPAQTIYHPSGVFMRFHDDIVAVSPAAEGGSVIYLDEASRGFRRWFPYVGAFWAVNASRGTGGSGFRGGGPGGGGK